MGRRDPPETPPGEKGTDGRDGTPEPPDDDHTSSTGPGDDAPVPHFADGESIPSLTVFPPPGYAPADDDGDAGPSQRGDRGAGDHPAAAADDGSFAGMEDELDDAADAPPDDDLVFDDPSGDDEVRGARLTPSVFLPDGDGDSVVEGAAGPAVGGSGAPRGAGGDSSESAMFSAVVEESTAFEGIGAASESFSGDSQGIGDGTPLTADVAVVRSTGGGTGRRDAAPLRQFTAIVLGGLLSLPVTYAILLWGFQRDPLRLAPSLPAAVRAWVPGGARRGAIAPQGRPGIDRLPMPGDAAERVAAAATGVDDARGALRSAVARAQAARASFVDGKADRAERSPDGWYRDLAVAAERLVALDEAARTAGTPLVAPGDELGLGEFRGGDADALSDDVDRSGRAWLDDDDRGSNGGVMVGILESAAERSSLWSSRVRLASPGGGDGDRAARTMVVLSRRPPRAVSGERVVVAGVIVADGVVWAADVWTLPR